MSRVAKLKDSGSGWDDIKFVGQFFEYVGESPERSELDNMSEYN